MSALSYTILAVCVALASATPNPLFGGMGAAQSAMSSSSSVSEVVETASSTASSATSAMGAGVSSIGAGVSSMGAGSYMDTLRGYYGQLPSYLPRWGVPMSGFPGMAL